MLDDDHEDGLRWIRQWFADVFYPLVGDPTKLDPEQRPSRARHIIRALGPPTPLEHLMPDTLPSYEPAQRGLERAW